MAICLERGADLHMAQLMPLPLIGFTFLLPAHPGSPGKGPLNVCVCVLSLELLLGLTVNRFLTLVSTVTVKSNKRSSIRKTTNANNTDNAMDAGFECHFAVCYSGLGDNKDILENPLH